MKPLLLDILACPICKYYPLKLDILRWETSENKFINILKAVENKDMDYLKKATKIRRGKERIDDCFNFIRGDTILIRDEMVRDNSNIIEYLGGVEEKLENFKVIEDHTGEKFSLCLNRIKKEVIEQVLKTKTDVSSQKIEEISLEIQDQLVDSIISDLYLLNWFFVFSEIEEGVIYCEKCSRWYPIIETIPQMLPDDLREQGPEVNFLKKWESKLPKKIKEKGKPFNIIK